MNSDLTGTLDDAAYAMQLLNGPAARDVTFANDSSGNQTAEKEKLLKIDKSAEKLLRNDEKENARNRAGAVQESGRTVISRLSAGPEQFPFFHMNSPEIRNTQK